MEGNFNKLNQLINKLAEKGFIYNLSISGPIGSGKTTLCEYIHKNVLSLADNDKYNYYNEWIEHTDLSGIMLKKCAEKKISRLTLQSFILDEWNNQLREKPLKSFNLFERSISECSLCFCNDLTFGETQILKLTEARIAQRYDVPSIDTPTLFIISKEEKTEEIFTELINIIEADIAYMDEHKINQLNRIFGLKILDAKILAERIKNRNRKGEENIDIKKTEIDIANFMCCYARFNNHSINSDYILRGN